MTTLSITFDSPLTIDADVAAMVEAATTTRWTGPFDARSVATDSGWTTAAQQTSAARLWTRSGSAQGGSSTFRFDYGSPSAQTLLADSVYQSLADAGFLGFSLGTVLDVAEMGYDPPALDDREHIPHGGASRPKGVRAMLDALPAGAVVTDHIQEHVAHKVDLAQDSDGLYPGHLELAEETVRSLGITDVDPVARHMSPPLWGIVYGERSQTGRLMPPLTTAGRSDSLYHPAGDGQWAGLTSAQWSQLLCWQAATLAVGGHVPLYQMPARRFMDRVRPDTDADVVTFLGAVQDALAGTLLEFSQPELPLRTGREVNSECSHECGAGPDTATNPVRYVRQISPTVVEDAIPPLVGQYHTGAECSSECSTECSRSPATDSTGWGAAHQAFPVRSVLHAVRRDRETGDLCLVLINWTATSAAWSGWFAPWLYAGFGGQVSLECSTECDQLNAYDVARINSDGTETSIGSSLADASLFTCSGTSGTISGREVRIGAVPAYSLQFYRIQVST